MKSASRLVRAVLVAAAGLSVVGCGHPSTTLSGPEPPEFQVEGTRTLRYTPNGALVVPIEFDFAIMGGRWYSRVYDPERATTLLLGYPTSHDWIRVSSYVQLLCTPDADIARADSIIAANPGAILSKGFSPNWAGGAQTYKIALGATMEHHHLEAAVPLLAFLAAYHAHRNVFDVVSPSGIIPGFIEEGI